MLIRMPWLQLECSSRQVQDSTFSDPCNVERLFRRYSEAFTGAIVEILNDNSFRVEDDQGNLLSGRRGVGSPIPLTHVDRHRFTTT